MKRVLVFLGFVMTCAACGGTVSGNVYGAGSATTESHNDPGQAPGFNDPPAPAPPAGVDVSILVDRNSDRRPVYQAIYGVNGGDTSAISAMKYPVRRWGGNATTRYSWTLDVSNSGFDWFYMGQPESASVDASKLPNGSTADLFMDATLNAGLSPVITIPTIGWAPKDRSTHWGFSVAKYGQQQSTECTASNYASWCHGDAGNGVLTNGTKISGNDPTDTSAKTDETSSTAWIEHIQQHLGKTAANGGVRYYELDNEPSLWNSTHRDVHPNGLTYDELWAYTKRYGHAVKQADPAALILGPAEWGWCGYLDSSGGCGASQDRKSHGNLDMVGWYLQNVCAEAASSGVRIVDFLDLHFYPQQSGVALSDDETSATQALRLRSVRSLYDSTYVDESWINTEIQLIPRMHAWVDTYCPGTMLAITEYNFGNDNGITAAIAQAEVLAIFGREGLDLATRWEAPAANTLVEDAFKMYLSYDGAGTQVEGWSVSAVSSNSTSVSSYAIEHEDGGMFVVLINHDTATRDTYVGVPGMVSAIVYGFEAGTRYGHREDKQSPQGGLRLTLPARSATLVKLSRS